MTLASMNSFLLPMNKRGSYHPFPPLASKNIQMISDLTRDFLWAMLCAKKVWVRQPAKIRGKRNMQDMDETIRTSPNLRNLNSRLGLDTACMYWILHPSGYINTLKYEYNLLLNMWWECARVGSYGNFSTPSFLSIPWSDAHPFPPLTLSSFE